MQVQFGYKASAEQFPPRTLLELAVLAEERGFDSVAVSDHFQPWRHTTGHAPFSLSWLAAVAQRTRRILLGTSVLTPTFRYHPSVVAQAVATLDALTPGRFFLGLGSGEAMNETPASALAWPGFRERSGRLEEAILLIRRLLSEERVSFEGRYYRTQRATVYDRPEVPIPLYAAATGPKAAALAGRVGDGLICTSGKRPELYRELLDAVAEGAQGAGRDPETMARMIEIKVSYDHDEAAARDACRWWAALSLTTEEKSGIDDPIELERLADANADRASSRFIVSSDPDEVVERVGHYVDLGFTHLVFHGPGDDQRRFIDLFSADVLPRLRARFGAELHAAS